MPLILHPTDIRLSPDLLDADDAYLSALALAHGEEPEDDNSVLLPWKHTDWAAVQAWLSERCARWEFYGRVTVTVHDGEPVVSRLAVSVWINDDVIARQFAEAWGVPPSAPRGVSLH